MIQVEYTMHPGAWECTVQYKKGRPGRSVVTRQGMARTLQHELIRGGAWEEKERREHFGSLDAKNSPRGTEMPVCQVPDTVSQN